MRVEYVIFKIRYRVSKDIIRGARDPRSGPMPDSGSRMRIAVNFTSVAQRRRLTISFARLSARTATDVSVFGNICQVFNS